MKKIFILLYILAFIFFNYFLFTELGYNVSEINGINQLKRVIILRNVILPVIIASSLIVYFISIYKNNHIRKSSKAKIASILISYNIFIFTELVFTNVPKSHAIGFTYASMIWDIKYWHPVTVDGYRDQPKVDTSKKNIIFIGDSFTSGHGLKNVSDRFSNIAGNALTEYNFLNYGISGIGSVSTPKIGTG